MAKKKTKISANYLDKIPMRPDHIKWSKNERDIVTLDIENKGIANRIAQKLLKKPKISHIHLDANGSFVWQTMDGEMTITDIGALVEERFGESAHPTYERLAKFFQILDSYGFVAWKTM